MSCAPAFQWLWLHHKSPQTGGMRQVRFYYPQGFWWSGIWAEHSRGGLSLFCNAWGYSWEESNDREWPKCLRSGVTWGLLHSMPKSCARMTWKLGSAEAAIWRTDMQPLTGRLGLITGYRPRAQREHPEKVRPESAHSQRPRQKPPGFFWRNFRSHMVSFVLHSTGYNKIH